MNLLGVILCLIILGLVAKILESLGIIQPKSKNRGGPIKNKELARANAIANNYRTLGEVEQALRKAGLESSNMILA